MFQRKNLFPIVAFRVTLRSRLVGSSLVKYYKRYARFHPVFFYFQGYLRVKTCEVYPAILTYPPTNIVVDFSVQPLYTAFKI
jgi:hypothetical protein